MINEEKLMCVCPRIGILDDDHEFARDLGEILSQQYQVEYFASSETMVNRIKARYALFMDNMAALYRAVGTGKTDAIESAFTNVCEHSPYSVALVDLDLHRENEYEGYPVSESLKKYGIQRIIYTGHEMEEIDLDMLNSHVANAFINKTKDVFDELLPCIERLNRRFYQKFYNISHYMIMHGSKGFDQLPKKNNIKNSMYSEYIVIQNGLITNAGENACK